MKNTKVALKPKKVKKPKKVDNRNAVRKFVSKNKTHVKYFLKRVAVVMALDQVLKKLFPPRRRRVGTVTIPPFIIYRGRRDSGIARS